MSASDSNNSSENSGEESGGSIRSRVFRARPILPDPNEFRTRFRLTTRQADILLNLLGPDLQPSTLRSNPLSAKEKLLCALRFYASNSFNYTTGDAQGPCRESVRCAIRQVTSLINIKLVDRIKWPDDQDVCRRIASNFFSLARPGMPTVCGAVDGTLIILAFCPNEHMNGGWKPFPNAVLLGDSIYGAFDWLVPMRLHAPPQFNAFYKGHAKTRRVVECAFGLWKNRFTCLKTDLRLKNPTYCCQLIKACGYLHNFLLDVRTEEENDDEEFMEQLQDSNEEEAEQDTVNGQQRLLSMFNSFRAAKNLL